VRLLRVVAAQRGCLVLFEDLHWADPETLAIVEYLADNLAAEAVLCVATLHSEESSDGLDLARSLHARRAATVLELGRLNDRDMAAMAASCLGTTELNDELLMAVTTFAEGVPFLVEEVLASGLGADGTLQVPRKLRWVRQF